MKIIHTSDLHLGKKVNAVSMLEEQRHILQQIREAVLREQADAVILAGDIYDKPTPSAEAVQLFDDFLAALADTQAEIFCISGNHDSAERIAYGGRIMARSGVHLSPVFDGKVTPIVLERNGVSASFFLLPFIKPSLVRHHFPEAEIDSYNDAMRTVLAHTESGNGPNPILVTHQFITHAERCESEEVFVGGIDNIDASLFDAFRYVALGHLHRPQSCGRPEVRYAGSPLKYSFSEAKDKKSLSMVEISAEGGISLTEIPLHPLHEWQDLRGSYEELTSRRLYEGTSYAEDYVRITLTDENDVPDAMRRLQTVYHQLMELRYDNTRTRNSLRLFQQMQDMKEKSPEALFAEWYEIQNGMPLSPEQSAYLKTKIQTIWKNE